MVTFNPTGAVLDPHIRRHQIKQKLAALARQMPTGDEAGALRELVNLALSYAETLGLSTVKTNRAVLTKLLASEREGR